ncbi:hypothetical protein KAU45_01780 [bacterium]|nr:hypothetical protein [bacterium]
MRKVPNLLIILVLALGVGLLGCESTTDGDGDGNGQNQQGSIEWARALADPVGEGWDSDAFICFTQGYELDDDGVLRGPNSLLTGDYDYWLFWYTLGDEALYIVLVTYDGFVTGHDGDDNVDHYELPKYSNDEVKNLMNIASDEFDENLEPGDYKYRLSLTANENVNVALVEALKIDNEDITGWILLDADTGDILDTSW